MNYFTLENTNCNLSGGKLAWSVTRAAPLKAKFTWHKQQGYQGKCSTDMASFVERQWFFGVLE
jgi:hypothetical protein